MNGAPYLATQTALDARKQRIAFRDKIAATAAELAATKAAAVLRPVLVVVDKPAPRVELLGGPERDDPCDTFYPAGYVEPAPRKLTIKEIKQAVCMHFGLEMSDMTTPRRHVHLVRGRQVAMYLCKLLAKDKSFPEIGRQFGNRDHTTILHACRKVEELRRRDEVFAKDVATVRAHIERALR